MTDPKTYRTILGFRSRKHDHRISWELVASAPSVARKKVESFAARFGFVVHAQAAPIGTDGKCDNAVATVPWLDIKPCRFLAQNIQWLCLSDDGTYRGGIMFNRQGSRIEVSMTDADGDPRRSVVSNVTDAMRFARFIVAQKPTVYTTEELAERAQWDAEDAADEHRERLASPPATLEPKSKTCCRRRYKVTLADASGKQWDEFYMGYSLGGATGRAHRYAWRYDFAVAVEPIEVDANGKPAPCEWEMQLRAIAGSDHHMRVIAQETLEREFGKPVDERGRPALRVIRGGISS